MVKLTSFMAVSTLIIAPTFASEVWNIETRDVAEPHLFGRDMKGLFAREQDFELPDLVRRFYGETTKEKNEKTGMEGPLPHDNAHDDVVKTSRFTPKQLALHEPFHQRYEFLERDLDDELYNRDVIDDDLFERFYDDLD